MANGSYNPKPIPKAGEIYNHYKGGRYEVLGMAKHTETGEDVVVYKSLIYDTLHVRPLNVWNQPIQTENPWDGDVRFVLSKEE